jgi:hypothetical protein
MAANLQPISSDGGFTSGGNININNGSDIIAAINEDLNIIVQDEEDDGWALKQTITDGIGNNLSQTTLDSSSFLIELGSDQWQFDGNTLQVTTDSTVRGFNAGVVVQSMVSGGSPVASLQVVNSVNDPNIYSTFDATSSGANIKVYNGGSNGGVEHAWQFDNDGNLTLPGNTFAVNYANGAQVSIGGGGNTGNVTFDDVTVQGVNQLNLSAGADFTANLAYLQVRAGDVASHIHLDTGNNEAYDLIVGNDQKFVQVSSTGDIIMSSYDGNTSYIWTFDQEGNLILAGGESAIQSVANSSLDPLNPNVSTMILTPSRGYSSQSLVLDPTAPGHIHLRAPSSNIDEPLANIFLGGETSSFEVGYYNGSAPNVFIHSNNNTWTFDTAGTLVFPRDTGPNTTDPILNIIGGANPTITSSDASLAGPANLGISALNTIFTGFSGDSIKIYPDDGEIGSTGNLQIWSNSGGNTEYSWTFDTTGNLTTPSNLVIGPTGLGSGTGFTQLDAPLLLGSSEANGGMSLVWYENPTGPGNIVQVGLNSSTPGSMTVTTGDLANASYVWDFDNEGNLTLPSGGNLIVSGSIVSSGASPAPTLSGFSSVSALQFTNGNSNVTVNANSSIWTFSSSGNLVLPGNTFAVNYANGTQVPVGVTQDITSNGAMSIMLYDGNIKYNNYATVEPSTGNITGGNISTTGAVTANIANITTGNITTINSGLLQNGNSNSTLTANGNVSIQAAGSNVELVVTSTGANVNGTLTSTGKIGYASGSTVTQTTNRGNGVTINALAGTIITTSASMVANQIDTFSVANDQVDPNNDIVLVQIVSPNFGVYNCIAQPSATISVSLTGFYINIVNISGFTTTSDAITIRFMVIKAPNA